MALGLMMTACGGDGGWDSDPKLRDGGVQAPLALVMCEGQPNSCYLSIPEAYVRCLARYLASKYSYADWITISHQDKGISITNLKTTMSVEMLNSKCKLA